MRTTLIVILVANAFFQDVLGQIASIQSTFNCSIIDSIALSQNWPQGIASLENQDFVSGGNGNFIFHYSNGIIIDSFPNPHSSPNSSGMTRNGDTLFINSEVSRSIKIMDISSTPTQIGTINHGRVNSWGLAFQKSTGNLLMTQYNQNKLLVIDPVQNEIIDSAQWDQSILAIDHSIGGLTQNIYGLSESGDHLYRFEGSSPYFLLDSIPWCVSYPLGLDMHNPAGIHCLSSSTIRGGTETTYLLEKNGVILGGAKVLPDEKNLIFFPNPSEGRIDFVVEGEKELIVRDINGKKVLSAVLIKNSFVFPPSINDGIYFAEIITTDKTFRKRLILKRN